MVHTDNIEILSPKWKDNYVAIAMSSSNEYVPYLSVCLQSLIEHCSNDVNYDVLIFERNITQQNKEILENQIVNSNISLRFINPMPIITQYKNIKFPSHYNLECYFRLASPLILKKYKKLIFTDVDIIFERDIKDLYRLNVDNALGACQDIVFCAFCNTPHLNKLTYAKQELELSNPYKYFNTGIMLLNLDYFNRNEIPEKLLQMANEKLYHILEQDILNKYFKENITYLDDGWNFPTMNPIYDEFMKNLPDELMNRYKNARKNANIIHWAGRYKPWGNPNIDLAYKWWYYARKTPYYEEILGRYIGEKFASTIKSGDAAILTDDLMDTISAAINYHKNVWRYWRYKVKSNLSFGNTKERYIKKKQQLKEKLKLAKTLLKGRHEK